jgi:hypothetical protein
MLHTLSPAQKETFLAEVLTLFDLFIQQELNRTLYPYQARVVRAILRSLFVKRVNVFVKIARQAGKTEAITLLLKFLLIFLLHLLGQPLMAGIASPNGEQAKTDVDRLKKDIQKLKSRWDLEDRENNALTIRAYRKDVLHGEVFRFSLAPTTSNESKTLNLLVIEESHKINDQKRRDELDPMLVSTGGITVFIGVGCTRKSDFKRGCDGEFSDAETVIVPVDEVIRDRRLVYEQTGDPAHLAYEHTFRADLNKYGRQNPEIRRNYFLEDTVEEGNFVSHERFVSCGRMQWQYKNGILIPVEDLTLSLDWARRGDYSWPGLMTRKNDLLAMWKLPHVRYEEQIEQLLAELKMERKCLKRLPDGTEVEETFRYFDRITTVRCDSTGLGDFPSEFLRDHSGLPMGDDSMVKFTPQSKNEMYTLWEAALFKDAGDPGRFSFWVDDPLAPELIEQATRLVREYKTDAELLSPHAPEEPGAYDDACSMVALGCLGAANGVVGEIVIL